MSAIGLTRILVTKLDYGIAQKAVLLVVWPSEYIGWRTVPVIWIGVALKSLEDPTALCAAGIVQPAYWWA